MNKSLKGIRNCLGMKDAGVFALQTENSVMVVDKDKIFLEFNVGNASLRALTRDALIFEVEG
jgi:hypothetical protein